MVESCVADGVDEARAPLRAVFITVLVAALCTADVLLLLCVRFFCVVCFFCRVGLVVGFSIYLVLVSGCCPVVGLGWERGAAQGHAADAGSRRRRRVRLGRRRTRVVAVLFVWW